jgi:endonuclease YncB( thermonuclease family)
MPCLARALISLSLGLLLCSPAAAAKLTGQVLRVIDGDSLVFQPDKSDKPLEVRLKDIDAPEGCQPGGEAARDYLQSKVMGQTVQLDTRGRDNYGRTLGVLRVAGADFNERMVAEGHAWALRSKWNRGTYVDKERVAISLKRGLHAERGAILPSEFRRTRGPCASQPPASAPADGGTAPPTSMAPERPKADARVALATDRCDGRTHCSQMTSCAEAKYFLQNCPGVKMDGNGDGVPCERQWCSR